MSIAGTISSYLVHLSALSPELRNAPVPVLTRNFITDPRTYHLIMRFRAGIQNIHTFNKFTASLATLGNIAWLRLDDNDIRFTVIPEHGSQLWSVLAIDTLFESYTIQSQANDNAINLEVPLAPLQRALKSAQNAIAANIRLTKKDNIPLLSLTITTTTANMSETRGFGNNGTGPDIDDSSIPPYDREEVTPGFGQSSVDFSSRQDRETVVTQDVPVRVLAPASVESLHEPRCRDPEVHIVLPNLLQLKNISDRFTKLALAAKTNSRTGFANASAGPRLELSANMHGCLRLALNTDAMQINSLWTALENPELDPTYVQDGEEGLANHPSTRMKAVGDSQGVSEEGWATVRIDGRDWGRVLSVGRLGGRVIACFCHEHALILYVFTNHDDPSLKDNVLTYYISSYSP